MPTDKVGEILSLDYYIECRHWAHVSDHNVRGWIKEVKLKAKGKHWILVYKQDYSPIYLAGYVIATDHDVDDMGIDGPIWLARRTK